MKISHLNLRCFFIACFSILVSLTAVGQDDEFMEKDAVRREKILSTKILIDALYRNHAAQNGIPGLSYALVTKEGIIYSGSLGVQDLETKTAVSASSVFRMASMSKSFTALAILQLRDRGKIRLDDLASLYVPELKNLQYPVKDAPEITVRHLLSHLGGFPQDDPWADRQLADTEREFSDFLNSQPSFSNVPGLEYEYSNLGYTILGRIITNVSGQPYQQYITENILQPLGMNQTFFDPGKVPAKLHVQGYAKSEKGLARLVSLGDGAWGAMGGMLTSLEDFQKYMRFHMEAWPPSDQKEHTIIRRSSLREMHTPASYAGTNLQFRFINGSSCPLTSFYGFGLRLVRDCRNTLFAGHSGGLPGFGSNWNILPEYGIGIIAFGNVTYAPLGNFNLSILDTIVKVAGLTKRPISGSAILEQRKNELAKLFPDWKNAETSPSFAENFFADRSLKELKETSKKVYTQTGKIIKIHALKPLNRLRGSFILEGEKGRAEIFFTLSPEPVPKVQAMNIQYLRPQ